MDEITWEEATFHILELALEPPPEEENLIFTPVAGTAMYDKMGGKPYKTTLLAALVQPPILALVCHDKFCPEPRVVFKVDTLNTTAVPTTDGKVIRVVNSTGDMIIEILLAKEPAQPEEWERGDPPSEGFPA